VQHAAGVGVARRGWSSAADAAVVDEVEPAPIKMKGIELKGRPLYLDMQVRSGVPLSLACVLGCPAVDLTVDVWWGECRLPHRWTRAYWMPCCLS